MALKNNGRAAEETMKYNVKVDRVHRYDSGAIALDLTVNGVNLYGCTYRTRKDDPDKGFIAFPSRKGSDGRWYNHCYFPQDDQLIADIEKQIDLLLD